MTVEAQKPIHSRLILNHQHLTRHEQRFVGNSRDDLISRAINGRINILPSGEITVSEASGFNKDNFLHTEFSEGIGSVKATVTIDTRYVPDSNGSENCGLKPEVLITRTMVNGRGDTTSFNAIREFPPETSRVVVETIHRLMVGVLIDGGTGEDVVEIYDKATAEHEDISGSKDLITAFRFNSMRGGRLSYMRFRYTEGIAS